MNEQEKKRQRIYDLLNIKTKPKFLYLPRTKQRKIFLSKRFLRERGVENWTKNEKKAL